MKYALFAAAAAAFLRLVGAQTYQRLGACPGFGCLFPPDQADFLAGQYFDIRLEVHQPVNGSEATDLPLDEDFTFTVAKAGSAAVSGAEFFGIEEPELETWDFNWYEDLFAEDDDTPTLVNVASKAYRRVALYEPGEYVATLSYNNGSKTIANWLVRDMETTRKAKNVILFIGDGMTTNMITAARLIAHKQVNGKYMTKMMMDKFPVLGHQMTHSIDSFITDSANSATTLYSGHKTTVNALGVYADSSPDEFDDPKVETIAEIFKRIWGGAVGIISTAYIADATPAALTAHTRDRYQSGAIVDSFLHGNVNYTWSPWDGADVLFGGGAEYFFNSSLGGESYNDLDYYALFEEAGYSVVYDNSALETTPNDTKTLGIFTVDNMSKWLDRNVYTDNLLDQENAPDGSGGDAVDQPGLREMTTKAIDILSTLSPDEGFFLMVEAASIDKMMHALDYDRALGELLELDDSVKSAVDKLTALGSLEETLILVTADHGHGFDVMGSVDTMYLNRAATDRQKRNAIGTYKESGQSQYAISGNLTYGPGHHFPSAWDPRYTLFDGVGAFPDFRADYQVNKDGPREPATPLEDEEGEPIDEDDNYANPEDSPNGYLVNGTLPVRDDQGVHSLTDVPVFAMGPCQELFGGVYSATDVFFGMAECLGLAQTTAPDC
ncbi:alkaline phosphatase [Lineolata rhizophorae]|uniref:alkaline phosphatase n=1 Tax=Lineolata rhizophorae TaxID=578093 RepID=A0A6A6PBL2_9PEZI|nr:alkaline phosphatase [Lineolata rhizophorae]